MYEVTEKHRKPDDGTEITTYTRDVIARQARFEHKEAPGSGRYG